MIRNRKATTMSTLLRRLVTSSAALALAVSFAGGLATSGAIAQTAAPPASETAPDATVKALQEALNAQGIAVTADGFLNDATRAAIRTYQSQHHLPVTGEPDAATLEKLGVPDLSGAIPGSTPGPAQAMGDQGMMGMMTPEMMRMMQRMMGQGGMPGMTSEGQMPIAGMMMCPMMQMMMRGQAGMGMPGMMDGQAMLYGLPGGNPQEMTEESVRALLERHLTQTGNPRLRLGVIGTAADGSITAEIVTIDGALVQKLAFNRFPGLVRQLD